MAKRAVRSKVTLDGALMFPNDYLAAVEFQGRDVTLTISAVSAEALQMMDGGKKTKMVMRFERTQKKLVCNKTNADSIAQLYGTAAEKWVGKRVTLYPTRCLAFGEMVDCIRVRETSPRGPDAPPPQEPDEFAQATAPAAEEVPRPPTTPAGARSSPAAQPVAADPPEWDSRLDMLHAIARDCLEAANITADREQIGDAVVQWVRKKSGYRTVADACKSEAFESIVLPKARKANWSEYVEREQVLP